MNQRTWLVTGINSGFGRILTEKLLEQGDRVAGTVRSLDSVADLKERHGASLWLADLDVTDTTNVYGVVNRAFGELGRIDVIVNNAGYGLFGPAESLSEEQIAHQIGTNLLGSIHVIKASLPHLREQGGGRILQISTYGGQAAGPGGSLYHASKWGIEGFCEALMVELAPFGIGVTIAEPGGARTGFRSRGAQLGERLEAYEGTPAAMPYRVLGDPSIKPLGDPSKMVDLMIGAVGQEPAPKRVVLGTDAYTALTRALRDRLADIEPQAVSAASSDFPAGS